MSVDPARPAVVATRDALLDRAAADFETRMRSARGCVIALASCALIAIAPSIPGASQVLGRLTRASSTAVAAVVFGAFVLTTVAHHALGVGHPLTRWLAGVDAAVRYGVLLVLVYLSGSASSPLWIASMSLACVWRPTTVRRAKIELGWIVLSHVALAIAFVLGGHMGDAWLTLLCLLASVVSHGMTAGLMARSTDLRAERDILDERLRDATARRDRERMARELHDGVGADVMAMVLKLRRVAAQPGADPTIARLADRARTLLDELRGVVWSLRNEQGTLGELSKLIDASCRNVHGSAAYARTTPLDATTKHIGPRAALAALGLSRELVKQAAARSGVSKVTLTLSAEDALEQAIEDDGDPLSIDTNAAAAFAIDGIRSAFDAASTPIAIANLASGRGVRVHARIELDPLTEPATTS